MSLGYAYCLKKYYDTFDSAELLHQIQQSISTNIIGISREFQFIFYKMLYTDPCSYWNKDVFTQTYTQLESLFQSHGNLLEIDEPIFNYFLMGYNSYCQISDIIMDLRACLKTFDKNGGVGDNRKKQAGAGKNASIPK